MTGNNQINSSLSAPNKSMQETGNINQMLEQLHADFDPVYSMLMNYQCAVMEVETKFNVLNNRLSLQDEHNPIESIKSRVKSLDSIIRKLDKLGLPITIESAEENLHDIAGVRVVCSFVDDIYRIEECFLAQEDVTLVKRKDYIRDPKPSGYRSLHLIIKTPVYTENRKKDMLVEIQMRTIAMDFWASLEHKIQYKFEGDNNTPMYISNDLRDCAKIVRDLDARMLALNKAIQESGTEE